MSKIAQQVITSLGPLPSLPDVDPTRNPLDAFRLDIASQLSKILELPLEKVYEGVATGSKVGDFSVAVPRFRLPGKPNELAEKIGKEVRCRPGPYGIGSLKLRLCALT